MPQLAFFPWIELACDINTGGYSLRRFVRGRLPGPDPDGQATIDAVLDPYRDLTDRLIRNAVILAAHDRGLTEDLSEEDRTDLFLFAELWQPSREVPEDEWASADRQAMEARHPTGLLGVRPADLSREPGARTRREQTAIAVDGSRTPAVDLFRGPPARQAGPVGAGAL